MMKWVTSHLENREGGLPADVPGLPSSILTLRNAQQWVISHIRRSENAGSFCEILISDYARAARMSRRLGLQEVKLQELTNQIMHITERVRPQCRLATSVVGDYPRD